MRGVEPRDTRMPPLPLYNRPTKSRYTYTLRVSFHLTTATKFHMFRIERLRRRRTKLQRRKENSIASKEGEYATLGAYWHYRYTFRCRMHGCAVKWVSMQSNAVDPTERVRKRICMIQISRLSHPLFTMSQHPNNMRTN